MAWIESHTTLRAHKKLKPFCDDLGITRAQAIGHLHMLWWWAIEHRETGDLNDLYPHDIAAACDWHRDAKKLVKALKKHGWITSSNTIKDWMEYAGRLVNERIRTRKKRANLLTDPKHDTGQTMVVSAATQPNRTQPNQTGSNGLLKEPQEKVIRTLLSGRLNHDVGCEANDIALKELLEGIKNDPEVKDPMAVAIHRATYGFQKK